MRRESKSAYSTELRLIKAYCTALSSCSYILHSIPATQQQQLQTFINIYLLFNGEHSELHVPCFAHTQTHAATSVVNRKTPSSPSAVPSECARIYEEKLPSSDVGTATRTNKIMHSWRFSNSRTVG